MALFFRIIAKSLWVAYLVLTAFYCICVFLPYMNYALIKAPPYPWIPWFAAHHALLYWVALICALFGYSQGPARRLRLIIFALLAVLGIALQVHPLLSRLDGDGRESLWAVAALALALPLSLIDVAGFWPRDGGMEIKEWGYRNALLWAFGVALAGAAGFTLHARISPEGLSVRTGIWELFAWSLITHVVLVLVLVSGVNLLGRLAARVPRPSLLRRVVLITAVCIGASLAIFGFLENSFSFPRTDAIIFSIALTLALCFYVLSIVLIAKDRVHWPRPVWLRVSCFVGLCAVTSIAVVLAGYVSQWDWNGSLQGMLTVVVWGTVALAVTLFPVQRRRYSTPAILAILILTVFGYKSLQATEIFWGKKLGATDFDIGQTMGKYGSDDLSFQFTHRMLGNAPQKLECTEMCRILRAYTNIENIRLSHPVDLASPLAPRSGPTPNIFVIVMDSMRPDFLGAYNPAVDFTPNMDAFARDSVVFHQAYSQYSGTTLSEPAIWAGLVLLHAHYPKPFSYLNNLEKMVNANHYEKVVSYDPVLKQILSSTDDLVKLDQDKENWRSLDLCETVPQLTKELDSRTDKAKPVFFYSQPMNVHQFAQNNRPNWRTTNWRRPGFDMRISVAVKGADECLGSFFAALKQRNLYDESIIILTSDHGDSTGAFGRAGHAFIIYPEIMRVPLLIHVPRSLRDKVKYDGHELASLTDITPSIYYLLGYRHLQEGSLYGHSLFAETTEEVQRHRRHELFIASDSRAAFGLVEEGKAFYTTYDLVAPSMLFDLRTDSKGEHNVLTPEQKQQYDQRVITYLKLIGDLYGYKPGVSTLLTQRVFVP